VITFKSHILNNILVICYKLDVIMFIGDQLIAMAVLYTSCKLSYLFFAYNVRGTQNWPPEEICGIYVILTYSHLSIQLYVNIIQ